VRNSDRAWVTLAGGVAAYDLIANDDEQLTNAARRYFRSQPIATASMIRVTAPHLVCGIPPWFDPITLTFASATDYRPIGLDSSGCFLSSVVPERTWSSNASGRNWRIPVDSWSRVEQRRSISDLRRYANLDALGRNLGHSR
jgi:hypothetical protein